MSAQSEVPAPTPQSGSTRPTPLLPPKPKRSMSRTQKILFFATGWLIVLMPFLFWWNTWFGRHLSDQQLTEYLHDDKKPRHIQQALVQFGERMSHHDDCGFEAVVSRPAAAGERSGGRGSQHGRLGHGPGHLRRRISRCSAEDAGRFFAHGARQRGAFAGAVWGCDRASADCGVACNLRGSPRRKVDASSIRIALAQTSTRED